jgi:hypothetical protein
LSHKKYCLKREKLYNFAHSYTPAVSILRRSADCQIMDFRLTYSTLYVERNFHFPEYTLKIVL